MSDAPQRNVLPAWKLLASRARRFLLGWQDFRVPSCSDADVLFISRPVYAQALPSGVLFDRIVDPLHSSLPGGRCAEKFYVSPWPLGAMLQFPAKVMRAANVHDVEVPPEHVKAIARIAEIVGLDASSLQSRYALALQQFAGWLETGNRLLAGRPCVKVIYLPSWYFPDMMGLTAAARQRGISVVEVQHGKQGRYQAMYSGWTRIPEGPIGYLAMPDQFWCWGEPSRRHILATSPSRVVHVPFVGGFPWLDYYRQNIAPATRAGDIGSQKFHRRVLVTTQPRVAVNPEPVPNFIVDFLRDMSMRNQAHDIHFTFRCHPNDKAGPDYVRERLADIPPARYSIDPGDANLYDQLLAATHHITAFSSCCYEATAFGVPTLLFGDAARSIYADEISSGEFAWTPGEVAVLDAWLQSAPVDRPVACEPYIESSLDQARRVMERLM